MKIFVIMFIYCIRMLAMFLIGLRFTLNGVIPWGRSDRDEISRDARDYLKAWSDWWKKGKEIWNRRG
jgi:hypothetical protein